MDRRPVLGHALGEQGRRSRHARRSSSVRYLRGTSRRRGVAEGRADAVEGRRPAAPPAARSPLGRPDSARCSVSPLRCRYAGSVDRRRHVGREAACGSARACGATIRGTSPVPARAGRATSSSRPAAPGAREIAAAGRARAPAGGSRRGPASVPARSASRDEKVRKRAPSRASRGRARRLGATSRARRWVSSRGISIFTGQTSPHAPHSEDAYGSEPAPPRCPAAAASGSRRSGPG